MPKIRLVLVVVLAGVLAIAGAACGGDEDDGEAVNGTTPAENGGQEDFQAGSLTVHLGERGDGQYGEATLTELGEGQTQLILELFDGPEEQQMAHVHEGTCDDLGPIRHDLNQLDNGRSQTRVDARLNKLLEGDFAVDVHSSDDRDADRVICAEIQES